MIKLFLILKRNIEINWIIVRIESEVCNESKLNDPAK